MCGAGAKHGLYAFVRALERNMSLRRVDLSANEINDWGARELALVLAKHNTSLVELELGSNALDDEWLLRGHVLNTEVDRQLPSVMTSCQRNARKATGVKDAVKAHAQLVDASRPGYFLFHAAEHAVAELAACE